MKHISVPHYENLSIEKIKAFTTTKQFNIDSHLPDAIALHKVSREWICNVIATVMGTVFTDWVKEKIDERNEEVKDKGDMNIELDPDVAEAFKNSTAVSCKYQRS